MHRARAWMFGLAATAACAGPPLPPERLPVEATLPPLQTLALARGPLPTAPARLTFHSDREGRHRLFSVELPSGRVRRLTDGRDHHDEEPVWSPDGTQLAFTTTRFDHATFDLATLDVGTGAIRRVTDHVAFERRPAWAADGRRLFYTSDHEGLEAVYQVTLDALGKRVRVSPVGLRGRMPAAAADGTVAYVEGSTEGLRAVVQSAKGAARVVSLPRTEAADVRLNARGSLLAYAALSPAGAEVHVAHLTTGEVDRFAIEGLPSIREPAWSPDDRYLAVAGSTGHGSNADWDLFVLDLTSPRRAYRVTDGGRSDRAPTWDPR